MYQEAPIQGLAQSICINAKVVDDFCDATPDRGENKSLPDDAPQNVKDAQQSILEAAVRIQQLSVDPSEYLTRQAIQVWPRPCAKISKTKNRFPCNPQYLTDTVPTIRVSAMALSFPCHLPRPAAGFGTIL
jgi:hypothetical protein